MPMVACSTTTPSVTEMDAAQALLQLHCDIRLPLTLAERNGEMDVENTMTAAFYLTKMFEPAATSSPYTEASVLPNKNLLSTSQNSDSKPNSPKFQHHARMDELIQKVKARTNGVRKNMEPAFLKRLNVMKRRPSKSFNKKNSQESSSESETYDTHTHIQLDNVKVYAKPQTREIGTQTDLIWMDLEASTAKIRDLYEQLNALQDQLKMHQCELLSFEEEDLTTDDSDEEYQIQSKNKRNKRKAKELNDTDVSFREVTEQNLDRSENDTSVTEENCSTLSKNVLRNRDVNTINGDLVPIGDGYAKVPSRILKNMNWNSYTSATRKLLTAIFSRRVLATHSLTGKPSPAFPDKPAKKKLDPTLVNDIVQTVVDKCRVPENVVRTSITTKCADESKMLRTRQQNQRKRPNKNNRENVPPATSESDE